MIDASGEGGDSDEEKEETEAPPAECPAHKPATKTKGVMTDEVIVANSLGFLFAGNETTASALSFASYSLALHPDIQEKLQSEIDAYFDEKPVSSITMWCVLLPLTCTKAHTSVPALPQDASLYTAAQEITYLDNVLQETLRRYPPLLEYVSRGK